MLFDHLEVYEDPEPRPGALNMALDEVLLRESSSPVLRIYQWSEPSVSFGYFGKLEAAVHAWPNHAPVRRWTGGGIVPHGNDFTYTLVVPASADFCKLGPLESYRQIHEIIAAVLQHRGMPAHLIARAKAAPGSECFVSPTSFDVMVEGKKIAGAAQRRTREGLLHQGSIQLPNLEDRFRNELAAAFSKQRERRSLSRTQIESAQRLAFEKYQTPEWLHRF